MAAEEGFEELLRQQQMQQWMGQGEAAARGAGGIGRQRSPFKPRDVKPVQGVLGKGCAGA